MLAFFLSGCFVLVLLSEHRPLAKLRVEEGH